MDQPVKKRKSIEKLTPEEENFLEEHLQEWLKKVLDTEPCDVEKFARTMRKCYKLAGLERPKVVEVLPSPKVTGITGPVVQFLVEQGDKDGCVYQVLPEDLVEDESGTAAEYVNRLLVKLRGKKDLQRWQDSSTLDIVIKRNAHRYVGGVFWLGWAATTSFYKKIGLDLPEECWRKEEAFAEAQMQCTWFWPGDEFVVASDKPKSISVEDFGTGRLQLHCGDGPAVEWRDGYALWALQGVHVPKKIVMEPGQLSVSEIDAFSNVEVRRIARERFGEGRYLVESGARVVDLDYEGALVGGAPRALLATKNGEKWLVGTDGSTGRVYYMPVENVKKCRTAHEQVSGFSEEKIVAKS